MQDDELKDLQAQLQRERARLAEEIGSRFSSLAAAKTTSSKPGRTSTAAASSSRSSNSFTPRPATLGLGATAPKAANENGTDRRLKGLLSGKRKRDGEPHHERNNGQQQQQQRHSKTHVTANDSDDEETRAPSVSIKTKAKDPFKQVRKANRKKAKAAGTAEAISTPSDAIVTSSIIYTDQSPALLPEVATKEVLTNNTSDPMQAVRSKLAGARFRQINEELYTSPSTVALAMMQAEPAKMQEYHAGFREQTKGWPKIPVRQIFDMLQRSQRQAESGQGGGDGGKQNGKAKGHKTAQGGGRWGNGRLAKGALIVDLGAGEGMLAQWLSKDLTIRPRVLSFDLLDSDDGWVVGVDVAKTNGLPLPGKAIALAANETVGAVAARVDHDDDAARIVDVAVFCLSLMATNWIDKIREASRILRPYGELIIAEVTSRFIDVGRFKDVVAALGFQLQSEDSSNTHFVLLTFVKLPIAQWQPPFATQTELQTFVKQGPSILKPCIYKRR